MMPESIAWESCYSTPIDAEAHLVKGFLEQYGVPCVLDSNRFAALDQTSPDFPRERQQRLHDSGRSVSKLAKHAEHTDIGVCELLRQARAELLGVGLVQRIHHQAGFDLLVARR